MGGCHDLEFFRRRHPGRPDPGAGGRRLQRARIPAHAHAGTAGREPILAGAAGAGPRDGSVRLSDAVLPDPRRPLDDPDRQLHRQRQGPSDPGPLAPQDRYRLHGRPGGGRRLGRGYRLRHVHPSAPGSCGLEHQAAGRPVGPDLPERALCILAQGVGALGEDQCREPGAAYRRQRVADCRGRPGRSGGERPCLRSRPASGADARAYPGPFLGPSDVGGSGRGGGR